MRLRPLRALAVLAAASALTSNLVAAAPTTHDRVHQRKLADRADAAPLASQLTSTNLPCVNGMAGEFPCDNVDLLAHLPLDAIGGGDGNDIWGWADPETGAEYALVGKSTGVAIVDVTDPIAPRWLGDLGTQTLESVWRDIKVFDDVAYIAADAAPLHGIQAFDLTQLRGVTGPRTWIASNWHVPTGSVHNLVVNPDSARLYAVGSKECDGGPFVINLAASVPLVTGFTPIAQDGCVDLDGYTHDMQCVTYDGPDVDHRGAEICLASNEDTLTIWDLTDAAAPVMLSRTSYPQAAYTHQGWLTDDAAWFLVGDELDEQRYDLPTTTLVFDVRDLDAPRLRGKHQHGTTAIDHNMHVTGNLVHQANYRAGYRLLQLTDLAHAQLTEVGFFDIYPADDEPRFNGAWGVYPWLPSGNVLVSGIEQGLFVLRPHQRSGAAT